MNAETLKALKGSIRKWEGIVSGKIADDGPNNCPLCHLFWDLADCAGCPVSAKTGIGDCQETPYEAWGDSFPPSNVGLMANTPKRVLLAKKELAFLKRLLTKHGAP